MATWEGHGLVLLVWEAHSHCEHDEDPWSDASYGLFIKPEIARAAAELEWRQDTPDTQVAYWNKPYEMERDCPLFDKDRLEWREVWKDGHKVRLWAWKYISPRWYDHKTHTARLRRDRNEKPGEFTATDYYVTRREIQDKVRDPNG